MKINLHKQVGREIPTPLVNNGKNNSVSFRFNIKTLSAAVMLCIVLIGGIVKGGIFYKTAQDTAKSHKRLKAKVDSMELIIEVKQKADRSLLKAIVKVIMPDSGETLIKQIEETEKILIEKLEKQKENDKE